MSELVRGTSGPWNTSSTLSVAESVRIEVTPLRAARQTAGLTLSAFAEAVFVSVACASRWETGRRRPHSGDVKRIYEVLGIDPKSGSTLFCEQPALSTESVRPYGLAALRGESGLTRRALAVLIDVSPASVAHWECGRRMLPRSRLPSLEMAFGLGETQLSARLATRPVDPRPMSLLAQLRIGAALTQRVVAFHLGVSYGTVSAWERGRRLPAWPYVRRLATLYRCSVAEVAGAAGVETPLGVGLDLPRGMSLAAALGCLRRWRGESLRHVAACAHVNWQTLRSWESGLTTPSETRLRAVERALGVPCGSLARSKPPEFR